MTWVLIIGFFSTLGFTIWMARSAYLSFKSDGPEERARKKNDKGGGDGGMPCVYGGDSGGDGGGGGD